jgi:integrase
VTATLSGVGPGELLPQLLPEDVRLCELRLTAATLPAASGVHPKVAAQRLGHADERLTLAIYTHVIEGQQVEAAERLEALLSDRP